MSNFLPDQVTSDIRALAHRGLSLRAVARSLGISTVTAARYYPRDQKCPCGKASGHNGWCKHRYAQSAARQAFQAARSGKNLPVPPPIKLSRNASKRTRQARWLGRDVKFIAQPVPYREMYSIIGEARLACARFPREFRQDVEQEVIVQACAGYIFRPEIKLAAHWFLSRAAGHYMAHESFDQLYSGWSHEQ